MTIEVRHLLVKSTVQQGGSAEDNGRDAEIGQDVEAIKEEILAACRLLVLEMLEKRRER